jgi:putative sterol carrier protein
MQSGSADPRTPAAQPSAGRAGDSGSEKGGHDREAEFFAEAARRGHIRGLEGTKGTARLDIRRGGDRVDHWLVSVNQGDITFSPTGGDADCVIDLDEQTFQRLAEGRAHAFAAFVSNEIGVSGRFDLILVLRHIFPGPAGSHHPRQFAERFRRSP